MIGMQRPQTRSDEPHAALKALFDRANTEHAAGRRAEAEATCREILALDDQYFGAWHLLGILALHDGDPQAALTHIERAVELAPSRADCRNSLGFALRALNRDPEAETAFRKAIEFDPEFFEAHYQLGNICRQSRRNAEAEASYRRALALRPDHPQALNNLGAALGELRRFDEAAGLFRRAIEIRPGYAEAYINLGHALRASGHPAEAEAACRQALALAPGAFAAHLTRGLALQDLGRLDEALESFRRAKPEDHDYPKAVASEGCLHLLRGNFAAGWEKYEARWRIGDLPPRDFAAAQWRGEAIEGKTILLHAEQGFGDTIQFLRYLPLVLARGAKVIVEVQKPLLSLTAGISGISCLARGEPLPAFDLHCPLLSLPLVFSTRLKTIPADVPYLAAPRERIAHWRERVGDWPGLKVGIAWAGSPVHRNDVNRSIPLARLAPLLDVAQARWFSLQVGARAANLAAVSAEKVIDLSAELGDFAETAAAIANLDLVITVDTAVAHLAGALGKPVWTMLPFAPDWRWLLERSDSPWYPTMRLFRQARAGDWDGVVGDVRRALQERVGRGTSSPSRAALRDEYMALVNAANEYHRAKRHVECEAALRRALSIDPTNSTAWHVLALTRFELGEKEEAVELLRKALALSPRTAEYHKDLGIMLHGVRRFDAALASSRRAIELQPDDPATQNSVGATLAELGRWDEAITAYRQALALNPEYYECWTNLAHAQQALLKLDEAADSYRRALGIRYDYTEAQCSSAMLSLLRGDYANGFTQFEWRWRMKIMTPREFDKPRWQGESLKGRTVLLYAEQGFGDTLQCLRFVPEVVARGGRVILELPRALVRLATSLQGGGEIVVQGQELPRFDVHCAFMSLPRVLGVTLDNLPARHVPYLHADPSAIERWARRLAGTGSGLKIAIAWAGNPKHAADARRSIAIESLTELTRLPHACFYSVQIGERAQDLALLPPDSVVDIGSELGDFAETAAALAHMDLLITVDTAVAHLAGSVGRPCWLLLPFSPDWRWLVGRDDSPWYPSLRLFRQPSPGAWSDVIATITRELTALAPRRQVSGPPLDVERRLGEAAKLRDSGCADEAQALARRILATDPIHAPTLKFLAAMCEAANDHKEAADLLGRLVRLTSQDADAHYSFGSVLASLQRDREAIACYRRAISLQPDHADAHSNLGAALHRRGENDEAEAVCRRAIILDPKSAVAHVNLGSALARQERLDEAAESFRAATELKADLAEAHFNLALTLHHLGRFDEALARYRRAVAIRPDYADAQLGEGFLLLTMARDFPVALAALECRWRLADRTPREFKAPQWRGEPLQGRSILLHAEQGFGDSLMFLRYAPMVAARGGRVVIEVPRTLARLAARIAGRKFTVVPSGSPLPAFDLHCPLMSLPLAFATTAQTIPAIVPYLRPDRAMLDRWKQRLGTAPGLKVGVAWAGNPAHHSDALRSVPLERFASLFDLPGISFFSLQVGDRAKDLASPVAGRTADLSSELKDFAETAAATANLDLVITVDTAVAHLAGALGAPVWVLLPYVADWRWFIERADSPWYPTARLFRQSRRGDWAGVFARVRAALQQWVVEAPSRPSVPQPKAPTLDARYFTAVELIESGREADGEAALEAIIAENSRHAGALGRLAQIRHRHGEPHKAANLLVRAIESEPQNADAHNNLGLVLAGIGNVKEAEASYRRSIALAPGSPDPYNNLGVLLEKVGRYKEAESNYRRAMAIAPLMAHIPDNLGVLLRESGRITESIAAHRHALTLNPHLPAANSNLLYALNYDETATARAVFEEHSSWGRVEGGGFANGGTRFLNSRDPERRLRVGYVSGDFHYPFAGCFFAPLLDAHDRTKVEIFLYANDSHADTTTARLRARSDHWIQIQQLSDEQAAVRIREDRIDILVDLSGHAANNRMMLFARKPAPIQITWLGYPNTTGLPAMDYRFTDACADPPGEADSLHCERLLRLDPCLLCYDAPIDAPEVAPLPAQSAGHVTFASFNDVARLMPGTIKLWSRVLSEVPRSRLILKAPQFKDAETRERLAAAFAEAGFGLDRLELLAPSATTAGHLRCYDRVDIALDPLCYSGAATTCEALWMGVPMVTLRGDRHAARVGASILNGAGLPALIAATAEQYIDIAKALAHDLDQLAALRGSLRARLTASSLCRADSFASAVENAFRTVWRHWCADHADDGPCLPETPAAEAEALAQRLLAEKSLDDAEQVLRRLIDRAPERAMAWFLLARVRHARGDHDAAIDFLRKAISFDSALPFAQNDLGVLLQQRQIFVEAEACYRRAIDLNGQFAEAMSNLGALLAGQGRFEDAAAWYQHAITIDGQHAPALNNLGATLCKLNRTEEAASYHRQAIALKPDFAEAHYNLGVVLQDQARLAEALTCYDRAIALQSDSADAHWNRAISLLALGRYDEGWREHEWRWRRKEQPPRGFRQPLWRGEPLAGRTILLHAEQGIGDTLQFVRYVPHVIACGGRVILQVQAPLLRLLSHSFADCVELISDSQPPPNFDVHSPLLSLPLAFGTTAETIPAAIPYLRADAAAATRWRGRIGDGQGLSVGLVWAGSPQHKNDRNRSMALEHFGQLFDTAGLHWLSLQCGERSAELTRNPRHKITDLSPLLTDFADTAAAIAELDLVVTVDTATAHLAGALGRPVFILLPFVADWRWLVDRDDSPWYPTARLFRQQSAHDWDPVLDRVHIALRELTAAPWSQAKDPSDSSR